MIYLTTSERYDEAADAVVALPGPTAVDVPTEAEERDEEARAAAMAPPAAAADATRAEAPDAPGTADAVRVPGVEARAAG